MLDHRNSMKNIVATFYPDIVENAKLVLGICTCAGIILGLATGIKDGYSVKIIEVVLFFESVSIPFSGLLALAGIYSFKIRIYETGIRSPSYFLSIPYKWQFIKWDEISEINIVRVFFIYYSIIISEDKRFLYVPRKMLNHQRFIEII